VKKSFSAARAVATAVLSVVSGLGLTACGSDNGNGSSGTVTNTGVSETRLYAVNRLDNSLMVFTLDSISSHARRISPAPVATIQGTDTGLNAPIAVAVDAGGYIYVANSAGASVTVYRPGDDGDATPQGTITGNTTLLQSPTGIALDRNNNIYVADGGHVYKFNGGQGGDVAPSGEIDLPSQPSQLLAQSVAVDGNGNVFVTAVPAPLSPGSDTVFAYAPGATDPYLTLTGSQTNLDTPGAITVDANGSIIVANTPTRGGHSITVYTSSNVDPTPSTTISGASANLNTPAALLVDSSNSLYAANSGSNEITIYAKDTDGNYNANLRGQIAPTATVTIKPTNTALTSGLSGIALGP